MLTFLAWYFITNQLLSTVVLLTTGYCNPDTGGYVEGLWVVYLLLGVPIFVWAALIIIFDREDLL